MAAAFLLGFIVDRVHTLTEKRTTSSWRAALAPIGIAVVALVPLIPSVPYVGIIPVPSSTYFASDLVRDLPPGQLALIYPYPTAQIPTAAYWQTEAAMRFVMPGGYFLVPQLSGGGLAGSTFALDTLSTTTGNALSTLYLGQPPAAHTGPPRGHPERAGGMEGEVGGRGATARYRTFRRLVHRLDGRDSASPCRRRLRVAPPRRSATVKAAPADAAHRDDSVRSLGAGPRMRCQSGRTTPRCRRSAKIASLVADTALRSTNLLVVLTCADEPERQPRVKNGGTGA